MDARASVLLKLTLVGVSVLLSTLAARRFGHGMGGTIAGLPMQRARRAPSEGQVSASSTAA